VHASAGWPTGRIRETHRRPGIAVMEKRRSGDAALLRPLYAPTAKSSNAVSRWDICLARAKATLLGTIEAKSAIAEVAKQFEIKDPKRLIAVRR